MSGKDQKLHQAHLARWESGGRMKARLTTIDDPGDPRLEAFRDMRERDIVGRGGFIAEGAVVVEQLLCSDRFEPTALLILKNRLAGLEAILARVPPGVPIFTANDAVIDRVAGFPVHRGVLAHGCIRPGLQPTRDVLPERLARVAEADGIVIAAVGIANHDNMGSIFRNAAAFGAALVLLDRSSCDPLYRKAIRVSAGSVLRLPFARVGSGGDALPLLKAAGFRCLALASSGKTDIGTTHGVKPTALFLGAEGAGLPVELLEAMETVGIGMTPGFDSLNVATAAAIALHHLHRLRNT